MDSIIKKAIVAVLVVTLLTAGMIPIINDVGRAHDADDIQAPMGAYDADELDGYSLTASRYSGHVKVESTFYTGEIKDRAVIVSTSGGSLWTDGSKIYSLIGNELRTVTSTTITVEGGDFSVDGQTVEVDGIVYLPDKLGIYGSYPDMVHGQPVAAVGSYAGVTVGSIGEDVTGNNTDYVLDVSPMETGGENGIEYVPGEYEPPVQVPPRQQAQVKPGLDLDVIEDPEIFEKGEITIIPGKGEIIGDIDMEDVIVTPGKLPAAGIQAIGDTSGNTGSCTWRIVDDAIYIDGNGATGNYNDSDTVTTNPWGDVVRVAYIGEGVTELGYNLFNHCTLLEEVHLPTTLTAIKSNCFRNSGLLHVDLPDGVLSLSFGSFRGSKIDSLICPESLTTFGQYIISGCSNLTELYIPSGASINTQPGTRLYALNGSYSSTPTGGAHYYGTWNVLMETVTVEENDQTYTITYQGTDLKSATAETVHIPYSVTYGGTDYTVKKIADGAISGSSVRNVVIPQTIESISPTAITGSKVAEVLNLSAVDVMTSHGEVRTSVPAVAVVSDTVIDPGFGAIMSMINLVPILIILALVGFILTDARGRARER